MRNSYSRNSIFYKAKLRDWEAKTFLSYRINLEDWKLENSLSYKVKPWDLRSLNTFFYKVWFHYREPSYPIDSLIGKQWQRSKDWYYLFKERSHTWGRKITYKNIGYKDQFSKKCLLWPV